MIEVSVVIPYYNRKDTIVRALDSVVKQTYKKLEIILVNDGSNDGTDKIVDKYIIEHSDIEFQHVYQDNGGPSKARNTGIRLAKGKYIAFLDSDDSWEKEKLEIQMKFMLEHPEIKITSTNYKVLMDGKMNIKEKHNESVVYSNFYKMLFKCFYLTPTVVVDRCVFDEKNIFFVENKDYAEDHLFFLEVCRKYSGAKITKPLANIYKLEFGKSGLSSNLNELTKNEIDNFFRLYHDNKNNEKKINFILLICAEVIAIVKHFKRIIKSNMVK